jgi:hypothetical protein
MSKLLYGNSGFFMLSIIFKVFQRARILHTCYSLSLPHKQMSQGFEVGDSKSLPITVAAVSKARTVFARSNAGIVGSNPTQGMDVCVRVFCVCVVL